MRLLEHLGSIGVRAELQKGEGKEIKRREEGYKVRVRQLAEIRVWLKRIQSIEVWRESKKGKEVATTEDEVTYVVLFEPGVSLYRIPILTNTVKTGMAGRQVRFRWRGFQWGSLPLLEDRLKADRDLNRRLLQQFNQDLITDLRVRALSDDRVGITTNYNPQRLPTREFLDCMEAIAQHVNDYVIERNRAREEDSLRAGFDHTADGGQVEGPL